MGRKRGNRKQIVEEDTVSEEEVEQQRPSNGKALSKKELRILNKRRKNGEITREEYNEVMGIHETVEDPDAAKKVLKASEYESGLMGMKERKGELESNSKDIRVEEFTLAYKGQVLLKDADLAISHGRKYGLIGVNGSGKSTLLRHISMRHVPVPKHINILHVEQEIEGTETSALNAVIEADTERTALLEEEQKLKLIVEDEEADVEEEAHVEASERLIEVYKQLKHIGAYSAEARAAGILSGLAFLPEMQKKPTSAFSGGWRMRIALARALFVQPDLLLLDEPTNHLDLDTVVWLETYLRKYKKTLLLVSHDRDFLNGIVTDIIDLRDQKLYQYKGDYDAFERGRTQKMAAVAKQAKKEAKALEQAQLKQDQKSRALLKSKRDGAGGSAPKKGKGGKIRPPKAYKVAFRFPNPPPLPEPVVEIRDVSFGYTPGAENHLFEHLELNVGKDAKVGLVGPNGSGKSTLVNMILGQLEPTDGQIVRNPKLRCAKFSQHFVDQLTMDVNAIEYIHEKFPELPSQTIRNKLGSFGLKGKQNHEKPIALLSGGQKSRVAFLEIALAEPHMIFFDEPTNHLDIESVDALSETLQAFEGALFIITHDQRLVSAVATELWVCRGSTDMTVERYDGDFDDYKQEIIDEMPDEWFMEDED